MAAPSKTPATPAAAAVVPVAAPPRYVLVKSMSQHGTTGRFCRAGLEFNRLDWRPLLVGDKDHVTDAGEQVIGAETLERLNTEPMLVVKDATAKDIETYAVQRAALATDPMALVAELNAKLAAAEGRLMALEMANTKQPGE